MEIDTPTKDKPSSSDNVNVAPFDLESYISRYEKSSETKLQRLLFIAKHASSENNNNNNELIKSCYEMIEKHCKEYGNVKRYKEVFGPATSSSSSSETNGANGGAAGEEKEDHHDHPDHPPPHPSKYGFHYDAPYLTQTESSSSMQLEALEARLKTAQAHLTKESIRSAYLSLADFHKNRGELREALHKMKKSQDYCTKNSQSGQVCLMIIELAVDSRYYNEVRSYISKAEHTSDLLSTDPLFASKLRAASALVSLSENQYADAALKLSSISSDLTNQFSTVMSAEDIALYGSILGLASLDRDNLQSAILDSNNFKGRLELVPPLRDALRHYVRAEYGPCLKLLSSVLPDVRLDIHLAKHIDALYGLIRDRCIVQYFVPYSTACMNTMANVFHMSVEDMEDVLARLIGEGRMPGRPRIDSLKKTVKTESVVCTERRRRREVERKVKMMGDRFVKETEGMILRMSCLEHGLIVQNDKQGGWRGQNRYAGDGRGQQRSRSGGAYEGGPGGGGAQVMYDMDFSSDEDEGGDAVMMDLEGYGVMNPEDV